MNNLSNPLPESESEAEEDMDTTQHIVHCK